MLGALRTALFTSALSLSWASAVCAPAVQLAIDAPVCFGTCPGVVPPRLQANSGQLFQVRVGALDGSPSLDRDYRGTVVFSSSDPLAVLPQTYAFSAEDQGTHIFVAGFITPGNQTIHVSDTRGTLLPGILPMLVLGPSVVEGIPAVSWPALGLLALGLSVVGTVILQGRGLGA